MELNQTRTWQVGRQKWRVKQKLTNPDRVEQSTKCSAKTRRNVWCRNRTRRSDMCQPHLMKFKNLRITDSNIRTPGLGLFSAYKPIERNRIITPYTGIESSVPINGNYVLEVKKNRFINANRNIDTAGFANDCRARNKRNNECQGTNAKFSYNNKSKTVSLVSTKRILPKSEIFMSNGSDYWNKMGR